MTVQPTGHGAWASARPPDPSWRPGGPAGGPWPGPERPPQFSPPRRRRRGRGWAVFLVLLLGLGAVWWTQSPDPRADLQRLTDPATYARLRDRAEELVDEALAGRDRLAPPGPVAIPLIDSALRDAPPAGLEESDSRLAPAVTVTDPSPAYRFAALQDDGVTPVAWSPCRPIHYVVNDAGAPSEFADAVQGAMGDLAAATGLVFTYDGSTDEAPSDQRAAHQPDAYGDRWAPVLVGVADAASMHFLDGEVAGVTSTYRVTAGSGAWHLVSGAVVIDAEAFEIPGRTAEPPWVAVLRHELGHLAGLDHVDDASQLMNPVTSTVRTYQAGDRTGLALLGQGACAPGV